MISSAPTTPAFAGAGFVSDQHVGLHRPARGLTLGAAACRRLPYAGAADLLALSREHWGIENLLHYVRDVTYREDQGRTNAGHAPQVLAALRNTALTMLRRLGFKPVEGIEHFAEHRQQAIEAIYGRRTE